MKVCYLNPTPAISRSSAHYTSMWLAGR